jgi:hypothetical protein
VDGDSGSGGGDISVADAAGDITTIEQNAVAFELGFETDASIASEIEKGCLFVERYVILDGFESQGSVHGSGFQIEEAKAAGEMGGEGAFAGASWPVDSYDGTLAPDDGFRLR